MRGWEPIEVVHRGARSTLDRARRQAEPTTFVLKCCTDASRAQVDLAREWEVLQALRGCEGVIAASALERHRSEAALVLEDFAGQSVQSQGLAGALSISDSLRLMLDVLAILTRIHERGFVHGDVSPGNVLLARDQGVRLIDFASSVGIGVQSTQLVQRADRRSLAYAAPEQTGRMRRRVDHRSDFYSFGVMLFELVTGSLPFPVSDPLELAHAHVARPPPVPRRLAPDVSPALSGLILRLLAKDPDQRYQSIPKLCDDLTACRRAFDDHCADFDGLEYGPESDALRMPDRLYGRDALIARLEDTIDLGFRGRSTVIGLEGPAGIGKTALANELQRYVAQRNGIFASGKFEADQASTPLKPLREILAQLSAHLVRGGDDQVRSLTRRLEERLPGASRSLVAFCPELGALLSEPAKGEIERQGAVDLVPRSAGELLHLASADAHPICIFIDDLHWATSSDLTWLREVIAGAQLGTVVLVLACRAHEDLAEASYRKLLEELRQQGYAVITQPLEALSASDVRPLLRDAFGTNGEPLETLAQLVLARSAGNPLFLRTFLQSLARDCTRLSPEGALEVDLERASALDAYGDVLELLAERMRALPEQTRAALKHAACLGRDFKLPTLAALVPGDVTELLAPAIQAGLLAAFEQPSRELPPGSWPASSCRFAHDRALQAVAAQIDEAERIDIHRRAGLYLLSSLGPDASSWSLFETVAHLNRAVPHLARAQRVQLAELNARAARAAVQRGQGELALSLAQHGIAALGEPAWAKDEQLTRSLYLARAEAAFGWAEHDVLAASCAALREHARCAEDLVDVLILEGRFHQSQQRSGQAIQTYLQALGALDLELPLQPDAESVGRELRSTSEALWGKTATDLINLPSCADARVVRVIELLSKLVFFSYSASNALLTVAACRIVRLSVAHGQTSESANGFAFYGLTVVGDHDLDRAVHFARIALELAERSGSAAVLSNAHLHTNYLLMHWKVPLKQLAGAFLKAYHYGLQAGSPSNALCSATTLCICKFWSGHELASLFGEMEEYRTQLVRFKQRLVLNWHEILMQTIHNLREPVALPNVLSGPYYDERARVPAHIAASESGTLFNFYIAKALLCLLFGDSQGALAAVDANVPIAPQCASSMWAVPYVYLDSLCRLEVCLLPDAHDRAAQLERVAANLDKLRSWSPHNPQEIEHRLLVLDAQRAWVEGRFTNAAHLFTEAVGLARNQGPHDEALICELAGRFWSSRGELREARACLRRAHRAYLLWGATTKARWLEAKYPRELAPATWRVRDPDAGHERAQEMDVLDLMGVIAASRAIAGEIRLDALLRRLMGLLLETAGAELGYLLLPGDGEWTVAAGFHPDDTDLATVRSIRVQDLPAHGYRPLRSDALQYVVRTAEPVLLAADSDPIGEIDPPALSSGSILCFPFKRQGKTEAIAYLENRLAPSVFTRASIAVLEVLSGQAVIALQNARLYQDLEQKVQLRTQELSTKNQDLERAMAQLLELQQQLLMKEKLAALGALTANISHEIKNPLNFVTNFSEVAVGLAQEIRDGCAASNDLTTSGLAQQLGLVVEKVAEHGRRAASIVDSMALHSPRTPKSVKKGDLNDLVRRHAHLNPIAATDPELAACVKLELDGTLRPLPLAEEAIGRVIVNLVSNSMHAVQTKSARRVSSFTPEIVVRTRHRGDHAELCVRDNGLGIAAEIKDKVFMPFFTSKPHGQGTGLGLSICHDIVVRGHGGSIDVDTAPGEFAEFTVRLPYDAEHAPSKF